MSETKLTRKCFPSTVVIGPNGPCVMRGYTEIGGIRIYDDQVQVGRHGHFVSPGWVEPAGRAALSSEGK